MLRTTQSRLASLGLVTLASLGPLGCSDDTVDPGSGACDLLAGDLVISEIVADVPGPDKGLEWFEIYNASAKTIDLEGRTLIYAKVDGTRRKTHTIGRSVEVPAGGYVVVGSMLDEIAQGMAHIDYGYGDALGEFVNSGGYLAVACSGELIDEAYYADPIPGASRIFDGSQVPDAVANDFLGNWCDSKTAFTADFAATPGAKNDVCGSQTTCLLDGVEVPVIRPALGDLVITEIHADPDAVSDNVGEWFEIHSLASAEFHLNGVKLGKDPEVAALETIAGADCIVIAPGSYSLIANNVDETLNGGLPGEAIVWDTNIALTNASGGLWLGGDDEFLDVVTYAKAPVGKTTQLDPKFYDPIANDDLAHWCVATTPYGAGDFGTPGAANLACPIAPVEGQCVEDGELRDIVPVPLGDLVITEFLADPKVVPDADGEWFEVLALSAGDLNGLEVGKDGAVRHTVNAGECITAAAGDLLVFARKADPALNGGIPQVDGLFNMALNNSNSDLFIGFGGEIWDQVTWTSTTAGISESLGAGNFTTTANDDLDAWCDGVGVYGDGDEGTPGVTNPACAGGPSDGTCLDLGTNSTRMINPPVYGDLVFSEIMANPKIVTDANGEWFEVRALGSFDLNGVQFGRAFANGPDGTIFANECLAVNPNDLVLFARQADPAVNGGLPPVDVLFGFGLVNSNGALHLSVDGALLDEVSWGPVADGSSTSLDPEYYDPDLNNVANASDPAWCYSTTPYGDGDNGTPGADNLACGGGGGGGMEGQCLDGGDWRDIVVPIPGDLVISEIMANPKITPDADGEWFEVRALGSFDLNGVQFGRAFANGAVGTITANECLSVIPNDLILFARKADPAINGGLPPVDVLFGFALVNSNGALHLAVDGVLLDEVSWGPVADGSSTSLDPGFYDPGLNDLANNNDPAWCYTTTPYGAGDNGTPGADNQQCG